MSATFEEAFGRVKQLVADFRANEKFYLSPACGGKTRKSQWPNFQKGKDLGRMCSRINGRCLFKKETFASHGCHSVERQQRHRIEVGIHSPRAWNQRLASAPAAAWQYMN
jgi:hypothetical protein